jgi:hypothetical protein
MTTSLGAGCGPAATSLAQVRRPISEVRPQLLLSTIISTIKPSCCCPTSARSTTLKRAVHSRSHPAPQQNPHSVSARHPPRITSAGSFLGGFRTPAAGGCRTALAGRLPKPCTTGDSCTAKNGPIIRSPDRQVRVASLDLRARAPWLGRAHDVATTSQRPNLAPIKRLRQFENALRVRIPTLRRVGIVVEIAPHSH